MLPNVCFVRQELTELLPSYYLIRDVLAGEVVVKKEGTKYLPMPNAVDQSVENRARYAAYLQRAVFYNVTRRTLLGLMGQVFTKEPVIKVPALLEPLTANVTGTGIDIVQLAKRAVALNIAFSRGGIFVDYPTFEEGSGVSLAEIESGNIKPVFSLYAPWEIVNWRVCDIGSEKVLSLVVIREIYTAKDDGFEMKQADQFKVLKLDEGNEVVLEIWREPEPRIADKKTIPKRGNFQTHSVFFPRDSKGNRLKRIPFTFFGSENNDPLPDNPNFYDLASLNVAHYRNSADYEENCYMMGQSTPVFTGLTQDWVSNVLNGVAAFGSTGGIPLPAGADAKLLQAQENSMVKEAMDTKERQMVALGARLVEQKTVQRTLGEAQMEETSEGSALATAVKNVSSAFLFALKCACEYTGLPDTEIEFELNTDYNVSASTPDQRQQVVEEWQKQAITFTEMRNVLRKAGIATENDEDAKVAIARDSIEAMGLSLFPNEPGKSGTNDA